MVRRRYKIHLEQVMMKFLGIHMLLKNQYVKIKFRTVEREYNNISFKELNRYVSIIIFSTSLIRHLTIYFMIVRNWIKCRKMPISGLRNCVSKVIMTHWGSAVLTPWWVEDAFPLQMASTGKKYCIMMLRLWVMTILHYTSSC